MAFAVGMAAIVVCSSNSTFLPRLASRLYKTRDGHWLNLTLPRIIPRPSESVVTQWTRWKQQNMCWTIQATSSLEPTGKWKGSDRYGRLPPLVHVSSFLHDRFLSSAFLTICSVNFKDFSTIIDSLPIARVIDGNLKYESAKSVKLTTIGLELTIEKNPETRR